MKDKKYITEEDVHKVYREYVYIKNLFLESLTLQVMGKKKWKQFKNKKNKKDLKLYFEDGIKLGGGFSADFNDPYHKSYFEGYADAMKDAIEDLELKKR
jgi:diaminopimelate decarboxylase